MKNLPQKNSQSRKNLKNINSIKNKASKKGK